MDKRETGGFPTCSPFPNGVFGDYKEFNFERDQSKRQIHLHPGAGIKVKPDPVNFGNKKRVGRIRRRDYGDRRRSRQTNGEANRHRSKHSDRRRSRQRDR